MGRRVLLMDPFGVVADHAVGLSGCVYSGFAQCAVSTRSTSFAREEGAAVRDIYVLVDALLTPPADEYGCRIHGTSTNRRARLLLGILRM